MNEIYETKQATGKNWFLKYMNGYRLFLSLAFGIVWLIDAVLKWQPAFINGLVGFIQGGMAGQPGWIMGWYSTWINISGINPVGIAYLVAIIETALAVGILFGLLRKVAYIGGLIFTVLKELCNVVHYLCSERMPSQSSLLQNAQVAF